MFPNRFDIVCLSEAPLERTANDNHLKVLCTSHVNATKPHHLNELIQLNAAASGKLFLTKSLRKDYLDNEFCSNLFAELYSPFECKIKCGHLESSVVLSPALLPFKG